MYSYVLGQQDGSPTLNRTIEIMRVFDIPRIAASVCAASCMLAVAQPAQAQAKPTIAQFLAPAMPFELVSAKKADRIAWLSYERGVRNAYAASAPEFKPVQLTKFREDDGVTLTELQISDDGSTVSFARGSEANREGWIANPSSNPDGGEHAIWAAKTDGSGAWRVVATLESGTLSPDGRSILFAKDGQIYRAKVTAAPAATAKDRGEAPFIKLFGRNIGPRWSPDGSKIAFTSDRLNHSFVAAYDMKTRTVHYLAPSTDFDSNPIWSPDGKQLIFLRRPGTPFGQQAQADGGFGSPAGPAAGRGNAAGGGGRGGRGGAASETGIPGDGLNRATFEGGYASALMLADVATDQAHELWHPAPGQQVPPLNAARWAGESLIFEREDGEWRRFFAVALSNLGTLINLTPGEGMVETDNVSPDGKTLFYGSNVNDIDRRHVWKVPTAGGAAVRITSGNEIEMSPAPLASGKLLAVRGIIGIP